MTPLYDAIGQGYAHVRKADPRIAAAINTALGDAETILNVGAGSGSYEPTDRRVIALDPSAEMLRQRPPRSAIACQGVAEALPFAIDQFDAAMAVLTVHHWRDAGAGLREMRRVARKRLVILTFDPDASYFWLADYIPQIVELDRPIMPKLAWFDQILGKTDIQLVPVPHDCTDGFLGAYWRRPDAYLDPRLRSGISTFAKMAAPIDGLRRLEADLRTGAWATRYADLLELDQLDVGYRLVVSDSP